MHANKHLSTIARALHYARLSDYHDDRGSADTARPYARRCTNALRSVVKATEVSA